MFKSEFSPLKHLASVISSALRVLLLITSLATTAAYADDYADVNRLVRAGQLPEALTKADQYLAGKPRDPQMRFIKGVIQTEAGKPAEAISTFTKITEDYPELPEPYNNLAVLYAGQSQFDKARAALEMAIRTNPSYATAHENLGDVYAKLASQAYSKALQLDNTNPGVQPKLALIRTLFSAEIKGQKPAAAPITAAPAAAVAVVKPAAINAVPPSKALPALASASASAPSAATLPSPASNQVNGGEKEVETAVRGWAAAWSSKDMAAYLSNYGQNFDPPNKQTRKAWEAERRARIVGKQNIIVKLSNFSVVVQGLKATAKFKQEYSADAFNVTSRKTLDLAKIGDRWVITKESTGN